MMTSFKDAIEKKNVDYNSGYVCECCNHTKYGKPWVVFDTEKNICSYLCYKSMNMDDKDLWSKVINKEDFIYLRPILPNKRNEFVFLTNKELLNYDDSKLTEYYNDLNNYYMDNPERASMQMEIMEECDGSDTSESEYSASDEEYWSD
jgi:hypothetical protein